MSESVHLMGIGGVGMAAVAELLVAQGLRVSGCDGKDSATLERLQALGIEVNVGHSPQHLTGLDRLILSSAILESNPELLAARRQPELVVQHRSEALAQLANVRRLVAVAGTHGKTTTSAMVVAALEAAGLEPSYAIGSELSGRDSGAHLGTGPVMVIEADESDGSFLNYQPEVAVVTNVEADHLDYYHTAAAYEAAFREFTARVQPPGVLVTDASDPGARALATAVQAGGVAADGVEVWTYGLDSGPAEPIGIPLRGRHMALNAQAALLVAQWFGADLELARTGLAHFAGTARRFELKGRAAGVKVIDDYAHHPTEISATLQAAREEAPSGRLLVLFQPHLYSRTREFAAQFAAALSAADLVWLLDVYGAREQPLPGVSSDLIADLMDPAVATRVSQFQAAPGLVAAAAHPGDLIFTMGAGDVTELGLPLLEALRQRESEGGGPSGLGSSGGFEPGGGEPLRSSELTGPAGP